jgi:trigger factor
MNIQHEKTDALNGVIRVKLSPDDFRPKYEAALKNYAKRANIKGFRPGHVPMPMVKKLYGKALLAEEVNRLLNDSLYQYITDNHLEILGNPLPKDNETPQDLSEDKDMEFAYEIGISPAIDLNLAKEKVVYNKLKVDDELVSKQIDDLTRRYGKLVNAEVSNETDMLFGQFEELENGQVKEGGITNSATVSIEFLHEDELKKKLSGLKPGDSLELDPRKVSHSTQDMASMLGIDPSMVPSVGRSFKFTVTEIKRVEPAELNAELFDKLFGEGVITDEAGLRARVTSDLENMFAFDSDRIFMKDVTNHLLENLTIELPDAFLKRWIMATNEKPIEEAQLNDEYPSYARSLKWQLIENKIIKDNDIKVSHEEAMDYTRNYLVSQYNRYGLPAPEEEQLKQSAMRILSNKEEAKRVYDELYSRRVLEILKGAVSLDQKEHKYDDFVKLAGGGHEHHHDHEHDHDHDHDHDHHH